MGKKRHIKKGDNVYVLSGEERGQGGKVIEVFPKTERVVVETTKPDAFYARLTTAAATDELGEIYEVSSPDDNLQAVFEYLVK